MTVTQVPAYVRAVGELRADFQAIGDRTQAANVFETGGLRMRFPKVAQGCEGVIINSGGGVAGGDRATYDFDIGPGAHVTLTTQSAEKIYRAQADAAEIGVSLRVGAGASVEWLPQETILIYGRIAMGEIAMQGFMRDRWRIRRSRRLIFAEEMRLDGDMTGTLDRPAVGDGARSSATFLHVAPDAEGRIDAIRATLADASCEWGASAWGGMVLVRLLSPSPEKLRAAIVTLLQSLRGRDAPRVWQ